jgi:apolipoprotein N-acyltransferase
MPAFSFARLWPWLAAGLSGLLLALCFPPFNVSGLAFVALIPLLCAVWLHRPRRRAAWYWFRLGYFSGLVFFTITFSWLHALGPLFHAVALRFLSFYLALYLSLFIALWTWFAGWFVGRHFDRLPPPDPTEAFSRPPLLLSTRNLALGIVLAAAWTTLEWARGLGALSFGWNGLGVAIHKEIVLIQIAEFTGVAGLTFMLVLCNVIGLITILRLRAEIGRIQLRPHFDFTLTVALVVGAFSYGVHVLAENRPSRSVTARVAMLQPDVPQSWKLTLGEHDQEIRDRLKLLHDGIAEQHPDLVLWPEASVPGGMLGSETSLNFVEELASHVPAILLGSDDFDRDRNSAVLLHQRQKEVTFYDKQRLVPFGEFLPFRPLLEWAVGGLVPADFSPGEEPGLFTLPKPELSLAPLICFEDTVGSITRRPVERGAKVLVNLTNDGWFGLTAGAETHLINSIFRAVENRRPLWRCTNTGISGAVDIFGRVDRWMEPFTMGAIMKPVTVSVEPQTTFYTAHGDVFALGCMTLTFVAIAARLGTLRRRRAALPAAPGKVG